MSNPEFVFSTSEKWQDIVTNHLGADVVIEKRECGAPVITNREDVYISVSHTRGMSVVMFSDCRCGIDIEPADRDMSLVERRYPHWCAREALYKMLCGRRGEGLLEKMSIVSDTGSEVVMKLNGAQYTIRQTEHEGYRVAYCQLPKNQPL